MSTREYISERECLHLLATNTVQITMRCIVVALATPLSDNKKANYKSSHFVGAEGGICQYERKRIFVGAEMFTFHYATTTGFK